MYIKFCRSYGEDKKDEASESLPSKLSVELQGEKGRQTGGNARLYRAMCLFLLLLCLVFLLVIVILSVKLNAGSTVCPEGAETAVAGRGKGAETAVAGRGGASCSFDQCQDYFPNVQHRQCHQCADGWLAFGNSCFYLSTFRLSWEGSLRNCTSRGGSLAIVSSQSLQSFLAKEGKLKYWIGLRQRDTRWTWVNKTELRESHWAETPHNGDCGILNSEGPPDKNWMKAPCQSYTYFICQLEL